MSWHMVKNRLQKTRLWRLLAIGLAMFGLVVLAPSCSSLDSLRLENFRVESADVPTLVSPVVGEPKTFNYLLSQESSSSDVLGFLYQGLIEIDQTTSEIVPASLNPGKFLRTVRRLSFCSKKTSNGQTVSH
ncbi:MAG: hypothetical protein WA901_18720 [Phormidesmis sp.]